MCTAVVLIRPGAVWPVVLAANRDERIDRTWDGPAEHWPGIVGGRDRLGGGAWLGLNRHGVVAAVLNRVGSLGPAPGKRSRGELPLLALQAASATAAVATVEALDAGAWRSFNMVIADRAGAWFLRGLEAGHPEAAPLGEGAHMVTAQDCDDFSSPRVARHLPRFRAAAAPSPDGWDAWRAILADRSGPSGAQINVPARENFGTVCSSLAALPADGPAVFLFAAGPPDRAPFEPVPPPGG